MSDTVFYILLNGLAALECSTQDEKTKALIAWLTEQLADEEITLR